MKKVLIIFISLIILCFLGFFFLEKKLVQGDILLTIDEIKLEFKGVVKVKYSVRNTPPTHLKIKTIKNKLISISPQGRVVDIVEVGDSVIKFKNENLVYIIKKNGKRIELFYTKISKSDRRSKIFPLEWKNKWMESSKWDTINY